LPVVSFPRDTSRHLLRAPCSLLFIAVELAQRGGQTLQVVRVPRGGDIRVSGDTGEAVQAGGEGADQDEADVMLGEGADEVLGIERRDRALFSQGFSLLPAPCSVLPL